MAILPQYQATSSTYGVKPPAAPVSPFARPAPAPLAGAYNPNALRTTTAGASTARPTSSARPSSTGGGIVAAPRVQPSAPKPTAPAPPTGYSSSAATGAAANAAAVAAQQAEQQRLQAQSDARGQENYSRSMEQQQMSMLSQSMNRPQDSGQLQYNQYGIDQYGQSRPEAPTPIPIAEGPTGTPGQDTQGVVPPGGMRVAGAVAPEVGSGWGDFAARPAGPAGLGMGRQSAPMQALRAMRAGGGVY